MIIYTIEDTVMAYCLIEAKGSQIETTWIVMHEFYLAPDTKLIYLIVLKRNQLRSSVLSNSGNGSMYVLDNHIRIMNLWTKMIIMNKLYSSSTVRYASVMRMIEFILNCTVIYGIAIFRRRNKCLFLFITNRASVNPNIHQCISVTTFWIHLIFKSKPWHIVTLCLNFTCPYSNTALVQIPYLPHCQHFLLGCEISYKVLDRQSMYSAILHSHLQMILILDYERKRIANHDTIYCMECLHFFS